VLYRIEVDEPRPARVTERAGGSTARAGWFAPAEAVRLRLTGIAAESIRRGILG
jgi:hypothetical protein